MLILFVKACCNASIFSEGSSGYPEAILKRVPPLIYPPVERQSSPFCSGLTEASHSEGKVDKRPTGSKSSR